MSSSLTPTQQPQKPALAQRPHELIGNTPLLKIPSLSALSGSDIYIKCEQFNPGGSIKDRAALRMVQEAIDKGELRPGMTIIEGTAGNTGIGLAIVGKSLGYPVKVVMPRGQTPEKEQMIALHGAELHLVDPVPFKNENHFYHTARRLAEAEPERYWWANQFENLANYRAHYTTTGPEIYAQTEGQLDVLVAAAGTGGTLAGTSDYLKSQLPDLKVILADPKGSGLKHYLEHGDFVSEGGSITEGIGIMRLVENFKQAKVDQAVSLHDQALVSVAYHVQAQDGILLGSSSALNVATAFYEAVKGPKGRRLVTFACDLGERSRSKLYNPEFLTSKDLDPTLSLEALMADW